MQRGVTVEQVRTAVALAQQHGIQVGMFLMWGYEGEELEDIAATVEHVKLSNPDIFFTTVSYPIKGTPYFDTVSDKVDAAARLVGGVRSRLRDRRSPSKDYYRLADQWLRNEVAAHRVSVTDPAQAAVLSRQARLAHEQMLALTMGTSGAAA